MTKILKLVLKYKWFDKIESGEKTHEYREYKPYWIKRLSPPQKYEFVEFQKGYSKNPPKLLFEIKSISVLTMDKKNDLQIDSDVFDIALGKRIK